MGDVIFRLISEFFVISSSFFLVSIFFSFFFSAEALLLVSEAFLSNRKKVIWARCCVNNAYPPFRYFHGDLRAASYEGHGTDIYIYLHVLAGRTTFCDGFFSYFSGRMISFS